MHSHGFILQLGKYGIHGACIYFTVCIQRFVSHIAVNIAVHVFPAVKDISSVKTFIRIFRNTAVFVHGSAVITEFICIFTRTVCKVNYFFPYIRVHTVVTVFFAEAQTIVTDIDMVSFGGSRLSLYLNESRIFYLGFFAVFAIV